MLERRPKEHTNKAARIDAIKRNLPQSIWDDTPRVVERKSRDLHYFSPVLSKKLENCFADLVVTPTSVDELSQTLKMCFENEVPITPRGRGTGNYGGAVPLEGGVVLELAKLDRILQFKSDLITVEPGTIVQDVDRVAREKNGKELRIIPASYKSATIGGFVSGGASGIGSVRWSGLLDMGNIFSLKLLTMERQPRLLELSGEKLHYATHAYGTNGIITELTLPLAPAYNWVGVVLSFTDFRSACEYANTIGEETGIVLKELAVLSAPIPKHYLGKLCSHLTETDHIVVVAVADISKDALLSLTKGWRDARVEVETEDVLEPQSPNLNQVLELTWGHTTQKAIASDPSLTYLQVMYPFPDQLDLVQKLRDMYPEEVMVHLEFVRFTGTFTCVGLPIIKFTSKEKLNEIIEFHIRLGARVFNPHTYTIEGGGIKRMGEKQYRFKRHCDPKGLLNPSKSI